MGSQFWSELGWVALGFFGAIACFVAAWPVLVKLGILKYGDGVTLCYCGEHAPDAWCECETRSECTHPWKDCLFRKDYDWPRYGQAVRYLPSHGVNEQGVMLK